MFYKKPIQILCLTLLCTLLFNLCLFFQTTQQTVNLKVSSRPIALVYRGPAGCIDCSEPVANMLRTSAYHFDVRYVGPNETLKLVPSSFQGVTLYAQPGGDTNTSRAFKSLGKTGQDAIVSFVKNGGRYLGICQGAYLAGNYFTGLSLLSPGNAKQYIKTKGALIKSEKPAVLPIKYGFKRFYMYFQDGAYLLPSGVPGEKILARYTNGKVAALTRPVGLGRITVIGPHPEAPNSWYRDDNLCPKHPTAKDGHLANFLLKSLLSSN